MILLYLAAVQAVVSDGLPVAAVDPAAPTASVVAGAPAPAATPPVRLAQDTPVELMAVAEVSTADVAPGTVFKLRVNRPVTVDGRVVIPVGTPAFGEVISATDSGGLGKSGRMTARLLRIRLGEADIPLEGEMSAKGTGAGSAGVAILFAGVAGFFHRGNNAKIKAGEILAGFIGEDVLLDLSSGPARRVTAGTAPAAPVEQ